MEKNLVIIGIIAIFFAVGLSGCNSTNLQVEQTPKDTLIGTWWNENYDGDETTYTFYNNGSVYQTWNANTNWYDYSIGEDKLIIGNDVYEFSFSDDNQKLIVDEDVFERR